MTDIHLADLSDYQPGVNFTDYRDGGRPGVFLKATEGTGFVASTFAPYREQAHAAGLVFVGLYHFGHTNTPAIANVVRSLEPGQVAVLASHWTVDHRGRTRYHRVLPAHLDFAAPTPEFAVGLPAGEAGHFLATISTLRAGEVAVLDAEVPGLSAAWCRAWCSAVETATGRTPMLYCSWSYWTDVLGGMTDYPLWIAAYHALGHDDPRDSVPGCRFWQYSDNTEVPGVGSCDDSVFRGTVDDLAAIAGGSQPEEKFVPGTSFLTSLSSHLVVDVAGKSTDNGAAVIQWTATGGLNQCLRFEPAADGTVKVRFEHSGKYLDAPPDDGSHPDGLVHQWDGADVDWQRWKINESPDGGIGLINASTGHALDVAGASSDPGTPLIAWEPNGQSNQRWARTQS